MKTLYILIISTFLACISVSKLYGQAPGGVAAPDFWIKSDDAGIIATSWKDHSANANNILALGSWGLSLADRAHNFHPYTTGYTGSRYFSNTTSVLNPTNGQLNNVSYSIFSAVRPTTAGTGRIVGIDDDGNGAEPGFSIQTGKLRLYKFTAGDNADQFEEQPFNIGAANIVSGIGNNPVAAGGTSTSVGGERVLGVNGVYKTYPNTSASNRFHFQGQRLRVGDGAWTAAGPFPGDIMEVIWYKRALTANEQSRVNTYLALKNGATLAENYLASNSNVVWDRTINTGYNNNIFGIARDNASALHQKQSGSVNAGQKLVIATTGFANNNAVNGTSVVNDLQFLLVGDNGLKQSLTTPLVYTGGTNGPTNYRFEAIWKIQNSGTVGTVTVAWPKSVKNLYLVQSTDATFAATDTFTPMTNEVTVDGVVYNTVNVTLTNGHFFTFAGLGNGPGGVVTNLSYWYRADINAANTGVGTDVTAWTDVWSGTTVAQLATNALPKYAVGTSSYFNFNPGINFTAVTQSLGNTNVQTVSALEFDIFTLTKENILGTGNNNRLFSSLVDNNLPAGVIERWDGIGLMTDQGYPNYVERVNNAYGARYLENPGSINRSTTIPSIMYHRFTDLNISKGLNGAANGANGTHTARGLMNGGHAFGDTRFSSNGSDNGGFTGHIGETIIYGAGNLTTTERRRVDSYLAIKYGITLGRVATEHYLDADATMVWNGGTNAAYNNNIFGVAREDIGLFEQKVSKSVNAGTILTLATNNDFVNPNNTVSRTSFASDKTYFLLGDNNVTGTNLTSVTVAGNTWKRIQRVWLSQRKSTPNALYFEADLSAYGSSFAASSTVWMLVADDAAFTTNVQNVAGTYTNGKWVFNKNFNADNAQRYITFATVLPSYCVTGDCNPNTFLNTSNPNTIEYDNMVSTFHSTLMRDGSTGELMVWGERMANNGTSHVLSPTEVNSTNYPALTGDVLKFTGGSSGMSISQRVVLTTDGLFAWGYEGLMIHTDLTSSTAFQKIGVGTYGVNGGAPKADGLPDGVAPTDVKMLFGTDNTLALTTCSGEAWVLAQNASAYGDGSTSSTANSQLWHQVHTDATTTLNNVVAIRGRGLISGGMLMALTASGEVYTWGIGTRLGNNSAAINRAFATQMTLPAGVTPKMIGATGNTSATTTYYILGTNGNVYSMGEGSHRQLGNFSTAVSNTWVQVRRSATAGDYLTNVVWISPQEHDSNQASINVLTADGRLWAWGNNDTQMLGETATVIDPTEMPGSIPSANPYNIGKLNWTDKVIAVETGGHTSMVVKENAKRYGYVGHRINGSMGDGTSTDATENEYNFAATPEINLCGTTTTVTPFPCDGTTYLLKSNQIFKHNIATGISETTPLATFTGLSNALAFSPIDNTLWLLVTQAPVAGTSRAKLTRVDGAGVVTTFDVPNLSTALGVNPTAAAITPNGYYVAKVSASPTGAPGAGSNASDGDNYVVIDVNPSRPSTYLQIVDPANSYAVATAPYYKETIGNVAIGVTDFTYNPADDLFYGVNSASNIVTLNAATGAYAVGNALSLSSGVAMPTSATYNSTYIDATGAFYAIDANGRTYRINIPSGNAVLISNAGTVANGDGASCPTAVLAYAVQGTVFNDLNGLTDNIVNGVPTNLGNALNAILYNNTTGAVAAVNPVAANGIFAFGAIPGNSYTVYLTTNTATVGQTAIPVLALPFGYTYTGEYNCVNTPGCTGNDGTANGILALGIVNGNIAQANFGVKDNCTNPGVFDAAGLPSTTGISDLKGFTGGTTGWPANVPNGHIVVESKNKGFVITRVSSSAAILNPVEGMLIYDIAAACVKLYNGTVWNCLAKDCVPLTN